MTLPNLQQSFDPAPTSEDRLPASIEAKLRELAGLKAGWDGPDSIAIKPEVLDEARRVMILLRRRNPEIEDPFISPSYDGLVQFEWHLPDRSYDLELDQAEWRAVGSELPQGGDWKFHEARLRPYDFDQVLRHYDWYLRKSAAW